MLLPLLVALLQGVTPAAGSDADSVAARPPIAPIRGIAIDERLAKAAGVGVGDRLVVAGAAGAVGDTVIVRAITRRSADPSEVARSDFRVRLHLDHLQQLSGSGDRVGRFAIATTDSAATEAALGAINASAFGFRAHRARDVAVGTSATFKVVDRFHRAIGVITIVASAIFLLCITLLKVDERRREVAALRLIGLSRRTIVRAVVLEASAIALIGSAMGAGLGWVASLIVNQHYQALYQTPLRFTLVTPELVLFAVGLSLILGIGAGIVAAQRLVRRKPLELIGR